MSWYEAAAYAEFAGKSLPTIYHWLRAAGIPQAASITPLSNLDGKGPRAVGSSPGVTTAGAFDMAGNIKEWCWNELPPRGDRYLLGGFWADAAHQFLFADGRPPFDRSETNGFRLAKYLDGKPLPDVLTGAIDSPGRDYTVQKPVPEQVFEVLASMYAYDQRPLDARVESTEDASAWVREKVSFEAAYADRMSAFLFLPKNTRPPYKTLIRNSGQTSPWPEQTRAYQDWMIQVVNDARRAVDYLVTRDDIQHDALAYYGFSWGSFFGSQVLALEPRFKTSVLLDGGFQGNRTPAVDSLNFAPRVSIPVLMVNGNSDYIFPVETSQKPLFAQLGTPNDRTNHLILPSGHVVMNQHRSQVVKEVLNWLDKYQGPVQR